MSQQLNRRMVILAALLTGVVIGPIILWYVLQMMWHSPTRKITIVVPPNFSGIARADRLSLDGQPDWVIQPNGSFTFQSDYMTDLREYHARYRDGKPLPICPTAEHTVGVFVRENSEAPSVFVGHRSGAKKLGFPMEL